MNKLIASQEPLGLLEQIRERKAKSVIANSKANIGDKPHQKGKYTPTKEMESEAKLNVDNTKA